MVADDYEEYMLKHWRPDVLCVQRQRSLYERATPLSGTLPPPPQYTVVPVCMSA